MTMFKVAATAIISEKYETQSLSFRMLRFSRQFLLHRKNTTFPPLFVQQPVKDCCSWMCLYVRDLISPSPFARR